MTHPMCDPVVQAGRRETARRMRRQISSMAAEMNDWLSEPLTERPLSGETVRKLTLASYHAMEEVTL